jgi:hypothetical protein
VRTRKKVVVAAITLGLLAGGCGGIEGEAEDLYKVDANVSDCTEVDPEVGLERVDLPPSDYSDKKYQCKVFFPDDPDRVDRDGSPEIEEYFCERDGDLEFC